MALFLREHEVYELLTMEDALRVVEGAFRAWGDGQAINRPRTRLRVPKGFLQLMPAALLEEGVMGFKAYTIVAGRARFVVLLFDIGSGELLALIEADRLGQMRTGAASGVAARYLAREDARTVGIIGVGHQAETQLQAICAVRKIQKIKAYSRTAQRREAFAEKMSKQLGIGVLPIENAEEAVGDSEIVITITTAREPVLQGQWLSAGTCVLAAGSNHWMRRELDTEAVTRASLIVVDDLEQAKIECGDLISAVESGVVRWEEIHELRHIVSGCVEGRRSPEEITLFESQGIALEDVAVGAHVLRLAKDGQWGETLELSV